MIVVADTRRAFLKEAVESVVAQDLDRSLFEIVVVKNFSDPGIDTDLSALGAISVQSGDIRGPPKLALGIRRSQGSLLTFLDYDDVYEPGRLRRVLEVFGEQPNLGFYHNRFTVIDAQGQPVSHDGIRAFQLPRISRREEVILQDPDKPRSSRRLAGLFPDFNTSCTAVHRSVVEPVLPDLERMSITGDTMLLYAGLVSNRSIFLDPKALTGYRLHEANVTSAGTGSEGERLRKLFDFASRCDQDYRVVREFLIAHRGRQYLDWIDARIWVNRLTMAFRSDTSSRRDFARVLRNVSRYLDTYPVQEDYVGLVGILPFLVSPSLGRKLYHRQRSVR